VSSVPLCSVVRAVYLGVWGFAGMLVREANDARSLASCDHCDFVNLLMVLVLGDSGF